jgi:hypothetical protein
MRHSGSAAGDDLHNLVTNPLRHQWKIPMKLDEEMYHGMNIDRAENFI